jgi:hypothetical protein
MENYIKIFIKKVGYNLTTEEINSITSDAAFGTAMIGFTIFFLLIGVVFYVFLAIGLMKMAENSGIKNAWLAWIPFANYYIMGELVTSKLKGNGGKYALWASISTLILSWIPILGGIIGIAFGVFTYVMYYWIYQKYSKNPVLHLILTIIIAPYASFAIFALRNNEPSY